MAAGSYDGGRKWAGLNQEVVARASRKYGRVRVNRKWVGPRPEVTLGNRKWVGQTRKLPGRTGSGEQRPETLGKPRRGVAWAGSGGSHTGSDPGRGLRSGRGSGKGGRGL